MPAGTTDLAAIDQMADMLADRGCSESTIKQYTSIAERFQVYELDAMRKAAADTDPIQPLLGALLAWDKQELGDHVSRSTIGVHVAALDTYLEAKGVPLKTGRIIKSTGRTQPAAKAPVALTDRQLSTLRARAAQYKPLRSTIELALAGIPISAITGISHDDINTTSYPLMVRHNNHRWQLLDPITRKWFRQKDRPPLPRDGEWTKRALSDNINDLVTRLPGRPANTGAFRILRETGIRRAIKYGIPPSRIAESLGCQPNPAWLNYPVMKSKAKPFWNMIDRTGITPAAGVRPAETKLRPAPRRLTAEEMMALTEAEYEQYLNELATPSNPD